MEKNKIVLIPAYNELPSLKLLSRNLKNKKIPFLVLNDGSNDGTLSWLKQNKINFINNKSNLGYEKNLLVGFKKILKSKKYKYIFTFDGDGQHRINDILKLGKSKYYTNYDMVVCNRNQLNRFSENILSFFFNFKFNIKDPLTGFKIYNINFLRKNLKFVSKNNFLIELISLGKKRNYKISNFKIISKPRKHSRIGDNIFIHLKILGCLKFLF